MRMKKAVCALLGSVGVASLLFVIVSEDLYNVRVPYQQMQEEPDKNLRLIKPRNEEQMNISKVVVEEHSEDVTFHNLEESHGNLKPPDISSSAMSDDHNIRPYPMNHTLASIGLDSFSAGKLLGLKLLEEISKMSLDKIIKSTLQGKPINERPRPQSMQVIIATTWRSGSTFLEQLLDSHPGVYNHYEPLLMYDFRRFYKEDKESAEVTALISDLLKCKYKNKQYLNSAMKNKDLIARNTRLWSICNNNHNSDLCYQPAFLENACKLFPWTIMKLVRLGVELVQPILEDKTLNAKVIFLVRDPRGIMNSRASSVQWCTKPLCSNPEILCQHMDRDLKTALKLQKSYPKRVIILRYEDLAVSPMKKAEQLFSELDLDFDTEVRLFIQQHTTKEIDLPWTTHRKSDARAIYWTKKMNITHVKHVQNSCSSIMNNLGYLPVQTLDNLTVNNVLQKNFNHFNTTFL